ncbi:MAG: hypothetical protein KAW12_12435 [Candidatus Aminicenantes bacterium]|nr:hypothetical protein [Candidatus Aminicenantes bacterium]
MRFIEILLNFSYNFVMIFKRFMISQRAKKGRKRLINGRLILLLLFFSIPLFGKKDNIRFKRITPGDGLSQSAVSCIIQDSDGFMWFGTQDGLNRYDGYNFKIYRRDSNGKTSISDNYIWAICESQERFLWIGTNDGGLNKFD